MNYKIEPLNEESVIVTFLPQSDSSIHERVQMLSRALKGQPFEGQIETVPAYHTVTVHFSPLHQNNRSPFQYVKKHLEQLLTSSSKFEKDGYRTLKIPVCYNPKLGPDLSILSDELKLSMEEIIEIHSAPTYEVVFIGFSPGFPFLSGMDKRLTVPRKASPRLKIEAGSVGIAGNQTGIYSLETPGGWNIIGRTPITLFDCNQPSPSFFQVGDRIKLIPISYEIFSDWKEQKWVFEL